MAPSSNPAERPAGLEQNIESLLEVRRRELEQRSPAQRFLDGASRSIGRPLYLLVVFLFVLAWISVNLLAPRLGRSAFDPSPFALLDGILSLAAVVSTTLVLIAQNRQTRIEQQHAHLALQVNLLTEQKVTKVIGLLEELRRDLPMVKDRYDPHAQNLAEKTDALEVLTAIEEVGLTEPNAEGDGAAAVTPRPKPQD